MSAVLVGESRRVDHGEGLRRPLLRMDVARTFSSVGRGRLAFVGLAGMTMAVRRDQTPFLVLILKF